MIVWMYITRQNDLVGQAGGDEQITRNDQPVIF